MFMDNVFFLVFFCVFVGELKKKIGMVVNI